MQTEELRWQQRLNSFSKALYLLNKGVETAVERQLNELEQQGLIQSFEFTHELAWKVLKDYFNYQGNMDIHGSRDATREAFALGMINDGEVWMSMIVSRNKTTHTYDEKSAQEIVELILKNYIHAFNQFYEIMVKIKSEGR